MNSFQQGNLKISLDLHSINPVGLEAMTWSLSYERFIHSEMMTHRWSRNASSSRAIPYERMKDWTLSDIAKPLHVGINQKGMQSGQSIEDPSSFFACIEELCRHVYDECDKIVDRFGVHKEIINRYTEPWGWINTVHSMGRRQLMNFFSLRIHWAAHPNIQRLAVNMARIYRRSVPQILKEGEWHLPFLLPSEHVLPIEKRRILSVARAAWTSYNTFDGKIGTIDKAIIRHDDCVKFKHVTPLEHQFRARKDSLCNGGPVRGYDQYRHMIEGESFSDFDFNILDTVYADRDYTLTPWA